MREHPQRHDRRPLIVALYRSPRRREGRILWSKPWIRDRRRSETVVTSWLRRRPSGAGLRNRIRPSRRRVQRLRAGELWHVAPRNRLARCGHLLNALGLSLAPPVYRGSTVSLRTRHNSPSRYPMPALVTTAAMARRSQALSGWQRYRAGAADAIVSANPLGSVTSKARVPHSVSCGSVLSVIPETWLAR